MIIIFIYIIIKALLCKITHTCKYFTIQHNGIQTVTTTCTLKHIHYLNHQKSSEEYYQPFLETSKKIRRELRVHYRLY